MTDRILLKRYLDKDKATIVISLLKILTGDAYSISKKVCQKYCTHIVGSFYVCGTGRKYLEPLRDHIVNTVKENGELIENIWFQILFFKSISKSEKDLLNVSLMI